MKLPCDCSRAELIKSLKRLRYQTTRQIHSHIRLTTNENGSHHVTIPLHSPLRVGTLASILDDVARHFGLSRDELWAKIK